MPDVPQNYQNSQWSKIEQHLQNYLLDKPDPSSPELLYSIAATISTKNYAEATIKNITTLIDGCLSIVFANVITFPNAFCIAIIKCHLFFFFSFPSRNYKQQTGVQFLTTLCDKYEHFLQQMNFVCNLFGSLNQKYCIPARTSIMFVVSI